jgi:hypothetical protein
MKNTLYYLLSFAALFTIIFYGFRCQKEPNQELLDKNIELTERAKPDTTYRPVAYGGTLKVYPYTIVPCYNKKTSRRDYQVVMYGDTLLPACKYQQQKQYDKINIADTALMNPNTKMYICVMEIK